MDTSVSEARAAIGLPADPYQLPKFDHRWNIVAKCPHCATLFGSFSADESDLHRIPAEDCGRFWMHRSQATHEEDTMTLELFRITFAIIMLLSTAAAGVSGYLFYRTFSPVKFEISGLTLRSGDWRFEGNSFYDYADNKEPFVFGRHNIVFPRGWTEDQAMAWREAHNEPGIEWSGQ